MLLIDPAQAKAFVAPLGQIKFDRSVGEMLMNADVAVSMPEMGSMFKDQVKVTDYDIHTFNSYSLILEIHLVTFHKTST